jgi:hypothetical protein
MTVVGATGSLWAFLEYSLIDYPSLADPFLYDAFLKQIFDVRSLFPGDTFQLAN